MRNHLRVNGNLKTPSRPGSTGTRSTWEDTIGEEDYSAIFREQFTEFKTKRSKYGFARGTIAAQVENKDIEAGLVTPSLFGKGQLLFVVRKADRAEASRLMSAGYRFAQTDQVSDQLARSMQINRQDLIDTVERLRDYCQRGSCMPSPGTYLACFALRAAFKTSGGSWDILVPKTNLCQLPMVALSSRHLELWQIDLLAQMDGLSVNQCIEHQDRGTGQGGTRAFLPAGRLRRQAHQNPASCGWRRCAKPGHHFRILHHSGCAHCVSQERCSQIHTAQLLQMPATRSCGISGSRNPCREESQGVWLPSRAAKGTINIVGLFTKGKHTCTTPCPWCPHVAV